MDNLLAPLFLGSLFDTLLGGVLLSQAYVFYSSERTWNGITRGTVGLLLVVSVVETVLVVASAYFW